MSRADLIEYIPLPNAEARKAIILDTLSAMAAKWRTADTLKRDVAAYVSASNGLDGRRLRKAVIGAAAPSIATARDPGKLQSQDVISAILSRLISRIRS
jgi:hypothetical protein